MSHYTGQGAINNNHSTYMRQILNTLYVRLAAHPLINNPPVWDAQGEPVRITKFRNFDGPELQNTGPGLTLSIFPYSFVKDDEGVLTSNSTNASVVYRPYALGEGQTPMGNTDHCITNIGVKLHLFGYDQTVYNDPDVITNQKTTYEFNQAEGILHEWAEVIRLLLVDPGMRRLPSVNLPSRHLLTNSFVNWVNFNTGNWTQGANLVMHTATILWQVSHYPKRQVSDPGLIEAIGGYIGDAPDTSNVGQIIPVCYDLAGDRYFNCSTNATLPGSTLIDPETGVLYETLNTNVVMLYDMVNKSRNQFITVNPNQ